MFIMQFVMGERRGACLFVGGKCKYILFPWS